MALVTDESRRIDALIWDVIAREGGLVEDPADRGGVTKYGVTLGTLREVRPGAGDDDVRRLTKVFAFEIYKQLFFEDLGLELLDAPPVQAVVFDAAVLHGRARAVRMLQRLVGTTADGILGPVTAAAVNGTGFPQLLVNAYSKARLHLVVSFAASHPEQLRFLRGWTRRIMSFIE